MDHEKETLLVSEDRNSQSDIEAHASSPHHEQSQRRWQQQQQQQSQNSLHSHRIAAISLALNVVLCIVCLLLGGYIYVQSERSQIGEGIESRYLSPAHEAVQYTWRNAWSNETIFYGPPSSDYESLWSNLLEGTLLNVTHEELVKSGEMDSVPYQTGGFAAGLGVGHHLHCLKRIKDFIWLDQLRPGVQRGSPEYLEAHVHADHCFDALRQQIMCHPDVSLYHMEYVDHSRITKKPTVLQFGQQKCMDFDKLHDWMKSRSGDSTLFTKPDWV